MIEALLQKQVPPNEEHALILKAMLRGVDAGWELGTRLLRFRENGDWAKVTKGSGGIPYADFTDYLDRGLSVSRTTAYRYMDAAWFPLYVVRTHGLWKTAWLRKILELEAEETPLSEALARRLPLQGGGTKPFKEMNVEEVKAAYPLLRDQAADKPAKPRGTKARVSRAVKALQKTATRAVSEWLTPGQVKSREVKGVLVLTVSDVPRDTAPEVYEALAQAIREELEKEAQ